MRIPKIQALGITQHRSTTCWNATVDVDGMGWLEAWGTNLTNAMEALPALAVQRVAQGERGSMGDPSGSAPGRAG